jgi:ketosteroid isomerase-like protein
MTRAPDRHRVEVGEEAVWIRVIRLLLLLQLEQRPDRRDPRRGIALRVAGDLLEDLTISSCSVRGTSALAPSPTPGDTELAMSQENVEIVRRLITEIWGGKTGQPDLASRVHPQIEIITSTDFPEQAVLRGQPGFEEWTRRWSELFEDYDLQPERFWEAGERVVVALHERGIAARSGIPFDDHYAHVWTFLSGLVVRVQVFRNQEDALEAAGMAE